MDYHQLTREIKNEAKRLGFIAVGIAPVIPHPHYQTYLDWIDADHHASMNYLSRPDVLAKRENPQKILENCQRIICLAMPYQPPHADFDQQHEGMGRISAYARTIDYHHIIWDKLAELEQFIREQNKEDLPLKSYVDTGPLLERSYASLAGIGVAGKNSCLIIPGVGSYFFLAEILTDLALPVDQPFTRDLCHTCRRCIDACPTGAIMEDHTINADKCISFLTIENKGHIPDGLKNSMESWVFGCDICQMVCPHNKVTPQLGHPLGEAILDEFIELLPLFALNDDSFKSKFRSSALSRAKRTGLLRNAAIVLGNQGFEGALSTLKNAIESEPDTIIKDACRWAVAEITARTESSPTTN